MLKISRNIASVFLLTLLVVTSYSRPLLAEEPVQVAVVTSLGDMMLAIDVEHAPISSNNFLALVDGKYYDGATFYRSVTLKNDHGTPKIEVIQGGLEPEESPFLPIAHESTEHTGLKHVDGAISLARGDIGTASTEFFICIGAQPGLDFGASRNADKQGFAVFGHVLSGMDVVRSIRDQPAAGPSESEYTAGQILTTPVQIISMRRVR